MKLIAAIEAENDTTIATVRMSRDEWAELIGKWEGPSRLSGPERELLAEATGLEDILNSI